MTQLRGLMARPKVAARWNPHILTYKARFRADRTVAQNQSIRCRCRPVRRAQIIARVALQFCVKVCSELCSKISDG